MTDTFFFQFLGGGNKPAGVQSFLNRPHHPGDYDDTRPVSQAGPVTGDTNRELGQGLGQ